MPFLSIPSAAEADQDEGVKRYHPAFGPDEVLVLRSVLTDEAVDSAGEAALKVEGSGKDTAYKLALISAMVLPGTRILNARTGDPFQLTKAGIKTMPPQLKNWICTEINKLDGSVADKAEVEIAGQPVSFSEAADPVGQGGGPGSPA